MKSGFTLIELSIVLVIIGLIVGGVLVGRDLISASYVRAQISQIEKFNQAVNTFKGKFGYLPGDICNPDATTYGFASRGTTAGKGDCDGVITGFNGPNAWGTAGGGETVMFWRDLSQAGLIDGSFTTATMGSVVYSGNTVNSYLPQAKIGKNNILVASPGTLSTMDGQNYFIIESGISVFFDELTGAVGITVRQAHAIDSKMDDAVPQNGRVTAQLTASSTKWAGSGGIGGAAYTTATDGSSSTCFDNSATSNGTPSVAGEQQHYSLEMNNGMGTNCALSFKFQ